MPTIEQEMRQSRRAADEITNPEGRYRSAIESRFPVAKSYNYHVYPDREVSKGYGHIETFAGDWPKDTVHYNNGFNLKNRYPGDTSIVFNPDEVTDEDIHNGVDGVLRGSMYRGDRAKARYAPAEEYEDLYRRYPELGKAYRNLKTYLESGYVEPATATAKQ